ncbi:hypothetical protein V3C99_007499 [Haemonchus contortus]
MAAFRVFVFITSMITLASAIDCYDQSLTDGSNPTKTKSCPKNKYCSNAVIESDGLKVQTYECDEDTCTGDGCSNPLKGVTFCCCSTDLCNSSSSFSILSIIASVVVAKLFTP